MEYVGGALGAFLIAVFFTLIFFFALGSRGPWGSFWTFFLVLLLIVWAASLWVRPYGPVFWGIYWVPLLFIGLIVALLLAAIPTSTSRTRTTRTVRTARTPEEKEAEKDAETVGGVFWVFLLIMLVAVVIGYAA